MAVLDTAFGGAGITLGYKLSSGGSTYVNLPMLADDCEFGGQTVNAINIAYLSVINMPKVPGRQDAGDFTATFYYVPGDASIVELETLFNARTTCSWQVQFPDGASATTGTTRTFSGFITSFKPGNFNGEDAPKLDITIAISGAITTTPGT